MLLHWFVYGLKVVKVWDICLDLLFKGIRSNPLNGIILFLGVQKNNVFSLWKELNIEYCNVNN
jgi:hypothetical protein